MSGLMPSEAMTIRIDVRAPARLHMLLLVGLTAASRIHAQSRLTASAPVTNIRYEITADSPRSEVASSSSSCDAPFVLRSR